MDAEGKLRERILNYWNNMDQADLKRGREDHIRVMAKELNVSEELLEKALADWEAGKSI